MNLPHPRVLLETADGITTITLNAPERLNAVDLDMVSELASLVSEPRPGQRVIVLRGAGRAFTSGADLGGNDEMADPAGSAALIDAANAAVAAITATPTPVVAVVQGPAAGVGVPIALAADIVVASTNAYFQLAFTRVGLMPDGGASAIVAASVGRAVAMRLALLADRLSAPAAAALGLIAQVAAPEDLEETVDAVVATLRNGPSAAFARTKAAVNAATLTALEGAFARERAGQLELLAAADFAEGARAFLEKRPAAFADEPTST